MQIFFYINNFKRIKSIHFVGKWIYLKRYTLQFCRYLYYLGKIRTIQLEYTDAKESLLQAARKAPIAALGFRVQCNKWAVLVRLLLGEIPERSIFTQKGMEKALKPYFELTNVSPPS